jgi:hypothetical protein
MDNFQNLIKYKKYLKYRMKYLDLIINNQIGGANFKSIRNSGGISGIRMASQCIWISIKDYLRYHRNIETSVRDLKQSVGLGPDTDYNDYDDANPQQSKILETLCRQLDIRLNFLMIGIDGNIIPHCLQNGNVHPYRIKNISSRNDVYIASFGHHFELIIEAPGYTLPKYGAPSAPPTIEPTTYKPKVEICGIYVEQKKVESKPELKNIAEHKIKLIEISQRIEILQIEIKDINEAIALHDSSIRELSNTTLTEDEKNQLRKLYLDNKTASLKLKTELENRLRRLTEEHNVEQAIINSLKTTCDVKTREELLSEIEYNINTPPDFIPEEDLSPCKGEGCRVSNKYYRIG